MIEVAQAVACADLPPSIRRAENEKPSAVEPVSPFDFGNLAPTEMLATDVTLRIDPGFTQRDAARAHRSVGQRSNAVNAVPPARNASETTRRPSTHAMLANTADQKSTVAPATRILTPKLMGFLNAVGCSCGSSNRLCARRRVVLAARAAKSTRVMTTKPTRRRRPAAEPDPVEKRTAREPMHIAHAVTRIAVKNGSNHRRPTRGGNATGGEILLTNRVTKPEARATASSVGRTEYCANRFEFAAIEAPALAI